MKYVQQLISTVAIAASLITTALLINQSNSSPPTLAQVLLEPSPNLISQKDTDVKFVQNMPAVEGIKFGSIQYLLAETDRDPRLESAILKELSTYTRKNYPGDQPSLRYFYNRMDLNGDGKLEVLTYLSGSPACGSGGCTMLIFKPGAQGYERVSRTTLVRNPILISDKKTRGWFDLNLYVAGGGMPGTYVKLAFDGKTYPLNPSTQPPLKRNATLNGTAVISDQITFGEGIALQPAK